MAQPLLLGGHAGLVLVSRSRARQLLYPVNRHRITEDGATYHR
jgi:hypothetical protein